MRNIWATAVILAALAVTAAAQSETSPGEETQPAQAVQHGKPIELKPDPPGTTHRNHRLILKDGTYQLVRQYQTVGDRVRYISTERGGDWEELPADLVDWEATRKWERDQTAPPASEQELSPAMREARALDREETEEREEQKARRPLVATGLELPDEEGVFALDHYNGKPALVEIQPNDLNIEQKSKHGVNMLNPLAALKATIELEGPQAQVHLHIGDPALYISLETGDEKEPVLTHPFAVDTSRVKDAANRNHGARSQQSGFAIVRLDPRRQVRIVGAIHLNLKGQPTHDENTIPANAEILPGKHWLKLTPVEKLPAGEYALVEILSPSELNQSVWDFRIDPAAGDNPGSLTPILDAPRR